jgi:hypothetical protein
VRVPHSEEVASHAVLESCVAHREVFDEALTEARTGQPLSHESNVILGADAFAVAEGNMGSAIFASADQPDGVVEPGMCVRSLHGNREISSTDRRPRERTDRPVSGRLLKP